MDESLKPEVVGLGQPQKIQGWGESSPDEQSHANSEKTRFRSAAMRCRSVQRSPACLHKHDPLPPMS
jgi:hypothetical protein